jgi:hypothetical protein
MVNNIPFFILDTQTKQHPISVKTKTEQVFSKRQTRNKRPVVSDYNWLKIQKMRPNQIE